jgi:hypothetical protein
VGIDEAEEEKGGVEVEGACQRWEMTVNKLEDFGRGGNRSGWQRW